jgi:hypothetical protein
VSDSFDDDQRKGLCKTAVNKLLEVQFGPFELGPDGQPAASASGFKMPAASVLSNAEMANDDPNKKVESGDPAGVIVVVVAIVVLLLALCGCWYKKLLCFKPKDGDTEQGKKPVKAKELEKDLESAKDGGKKKNKKKKKKKDEEDEEEDEDEEEGDDEDEGDDEGDDDGDDDEE